jgi:hypothetical protein
MPPVPLTPETKADFVRRIQTLKVDSPRKFGSMSTEQMLKHLSNAVDVALGDVTAPDDSKPVISKILFFTITRVMTTWPGGKIKAPAYWSPPAEKDFDGERDKLLKDLDRFLAALAKEPKKVAAHPLLGKLTLKQWSRLMGIHIHHHMRQFGV